MHLKYRKSNETDRDKVKCLMESCFGDRTCSGALDNLKERYLLCFDGDFLVAMTGICTGEDTRYDGYEVDWSCVHPSYRGNNLLSAMLGESLKGITGDVYCSCWHFSNKSKVNLHKAMHNLGFKLFEPRVKVYQAGVSDVCERCIYRVDFCRCCEDLYLLKL